MLGEDRLAARLATVEEHLRLENLHDLEGVLRTFGERAQYDDQPWDEHHVGLDEVRAYYTQLMQALPDLVIDRKRLHVSEEAIVMEAVIRGTHVGTWRGLPGTGRSVEFPLCAVYTFDENGKLAGERIYYDRASVLRRMGLFHEPQSVLGRVATVLTHPLTVAQAVGRKVLGR